MNIYSFNVCGVIGSVDLDNLKIKNCPYCKAELKLKPFNQDNESGFVCANCGTFLDVELKENFLC